MSPTTFARCLGGGFFLVSTAVALAGADHPPPIGFLVLVAVLAIISWLVARIVPTYIDWSSARRPWRKARVLGQGAVGGVLAWGALGLLNRTKEPSVDPGIAHTLLGFAVLAVIAALCALAVYGLCAVYARRHRSP